MVLDILDRVRRVHFVGIGGSGMSPLAEILHAGGYAVTGSDHGLSDNVDRLRGLGITVFPEHAAENLGDTELVVYTAAVARDNPELVGAERRGIPLLERAKLLGMITRRYPRTVAVAGTHGKTTTTSMLSQILLEAGCDPALFIGGRLPAINANGRSGSSDIMVCEACEFQDHYLEMTPAASIILNVDADHLDYFGDLDGVKASFRRFAEQTTSVLIVNADDANTMDAIAGVDSPTVITCGEHGRWQAADVREENGYFRYTLTRDGQPLCDVTLAIPARHNVRNSLAAAAAADWLGLSPAQIAAGIAAFHGAGRRFEILGKVAGVTVADDYAHHPTEIRTTLEAARRMGFGRVIAVFQPFTFSRTARHLAEFAEALSAADIAVVSDIMGSRETNKWNVSSDQITARMDNGVYLPDFDAITDYVTAHVQDGDLVLTMGGGNVYRCARQIFARLQQHHA